MKALKKTGLVFFPAFDWAIDPTHPEREERLLYTQDQVFEEGLLDIDGIIEYKPGMITDHEVGRTHFCLTKPKHVMTESHYISAGGAKTIARAFMEKEIDNGFALVRPPGHHAMRMVHGGRGFCNVNNEAIMIEILRSEYGVKRIAIVDTDCHHGDGTQDIFWHDPDVLFISLHQDGRTLYPGSGFTNEFGGPNAAGYTINIPLPPGTSEEGYLYTIKNCVLPILEDFKPEIIVNSAGQDNHYSDPITNMNFSAQGYAKLTTMLKPDIAVLEGGYSIEGALPYVNAGIILSMAGLDYSKVTEPGYDPEKIKEDLRTLDAIKKTCDQVLQIWDMRDELRVKAYGEKPFYERSRSITYDTDGIWERQSEILRSCEECGGTFKIRSSSDRDYSMAGIHIPVGACDKCKEVGYSWYDAENGDGHNIVCLQDRPKDEFHKKKGNKR